MNTRIVRICSAGVSVFHDWMSFDSGTFSGSQKLFTRRFQTSRSLSSWMRFQLIALTWSTSLSLPPEWAGGSFFAEFTGSVRVMSLPRVSFWCLGVGRSSRPHLVVLHPLRNGAVGVPCSLFGGDELPPRPCVPIHHTRVASSRPDLLGRRVLGASVLRSRSRRTDRCVHCG